MGKVEQNLSFCGGGAGKHSKSIPHFARRNNSGVIQIENVVEAEAFEFSVNSSVFLRRKVCHFNRQH